MHHGLSAAVNLVPVVVAIFVILAPVLRRRRFTTVARFLVVSFGLSLIALMVATRLKSAEVWPGHPAFPSGHMTFVVAMSVCVVFWDTRWSAWVTVTCVVQAVVLRAGHFHTVPEIIGGVALGLLLSVPILGALARGRARAQAV